MFETDLPIQIYRGVADCLTPDIDLTLEGGDRIPDQVRATFEIQKWIDKLIRGEINDEEYLEAVEPYLGRWSGIDKYCAHLGSLLHGVD